MKLALILLLAAQPVLAAPFECGISNSNGRIGVRVLRHNHKVIRVHSCSPAKMADIRVGDVIIEADGEEGHEYIDGLAGTTVHIKLKRGKEILEMDVKRVSPEEISDPSPIIEIDLVRRRGYITT